MTVSFVLVRDGHGDFTAGMEQSQRERGWELHQAVALTQVLMSSAWQHWGRLSLVFHAVLSHCSLTICFPAVTGNTALGKGARNSSLNSSYEYISKGQILWNDTLQPLETSDQWGEICLKAEIIQVSWRYLHMLLTLPHRLVNLISGKYSSTFEIKRHVTLEFEDLIIQLYKQTPY